MARYVTNVSYSMTRWVDAAVTVEASSEEEARRKVMSTCWRTHQIERESDEKMGMLYISITPTEM